MQPSWTPGNSYKRKDGKTAEFVGLKEYKQGDRSIKTPVFLHSDTFEEHMHYWGPVIPFITKDLNKDTELYGHMQIVEDDTKQPGCC